MEKYLEGKSTKDPDMDVDKDEEKAGEEIGVGMKHELKVI